MKNTAIFITIGHVFTAPSGKLVVACRMHDGTIGLTAEKTDGEWNLIKSDLHRLPLYLESQEWADRATAEALKKVVEFENEQMNS